jgi:phosphopantetheinyl transferase
MPLSLQISENDYTYALWRIEEGEADLLPMLKLSDMEFMEFNAFMNSKRKMHWLASRVLIRHLLNTDDFIELYFDEHRKPHIGNLNVQVSISHSGHYAAVLISHKGPVGIDIELISDKIDRVKHKFLSRTELDLLGEDNLINKLYACWSAKESLYKWFGRTGVELKADMPIVEFDYSKGELQIDFKKDGLEKMVKAKFFKVDGYMVALVVDF